MSSAENETVSGPEKDGRNESCESKSCKKQKIACTMTEFASIFRAKKDATLLDVLRKNPIAEFKTDGTDEAAESQLTMDLILQHASQFPSKLRDAIAKAKDYAEEEEDFDDDIPIVFVRLFRKCVEDFMFGCEIRDNWEYDMESEDEDSFDESYNETHVPEGWYGLDSDIDTEDEIELAIRFFPSVLESKRYLRQYEYFEPERQSIILFLAMSAQAVSFIPFFVDLIVELEMYVEQNFFDLAALLLLNETLPAEQFNGGLPVVVHEEGIKRLNGEHCIKLHEKGLATLVHLKEKGFLKEDPYSYNDDDCALSVTKSFLRHVGTSWDARFIDIRLQFLMKWYMEGHVEVEGRFPMSGIIHYFVENNRWDIFDDGKHHVLDIRMYELLLEAGISHFPYDLLGCAFDKDTFAFACSHFGKEKVKQAMNKTITLALEKKERKTEKKSKRKRNNNTLQSWVIRAATSYEVSLDGLYTLIRFDPGKMMNGVTNSSA